MYVEVVPNRRSRPAILLREGWREGNKVRKRTLANLSDWPPEKVEMLRRLLRGDTLLASENAFSIERSRPHGHVAAVLGTLRKLGLERILPDRDAQRGEEENTGDEIASQRLASESDEAPHHRCEPGLKG